MFTNRRENSSLLTSPLSLSAACLFSSPFDVIRTRLMNQRRLLASGRQCEFEPPPRIYRSPRDCFAMTWRTEGLRAFYKG